MDSSVLLMLVGKRVGDIRCGFTTWGSRNWRNGVADVQLSQTLPFHFVKFDNCLKN